MNKLINKLKELGEDLKNAHHPVDGTLCKLAAAELDRLEAYKGLCKEMAELLNTKDTSWDVLEECGYFDKERDVLRRYEALNKLS